MIFQRRFEPDEPDPEALDGLAEALHRLLTDSDEFATPGRELGSGDAAGSPCISTRDEE